jgi:addiction module HigA family antidote
LKTASQKLKFPHPGEIIRSEFLEPLGITQYRLAIDLHIPHSRVTAIIRGRRSITPDTALRLSRYFGSSAEFWIGLQNEYDLRKARTESGAIISSEVHPLAV